MPDSDARWDQDVERAMPYAERGAAFLDEKVEGWEDYIDLLKLDISSICNCVLGQLYTDHENPFEYGMKTLDIEDNEDAGVFDLGFDVPNGITTKALTAAWEIEIERRRKEKS